MDAFFEESRRKHDLLAEGLIRGSDLVPPLVPVEISEKTFTRYRTEGVNGCKLESLWFAGSWWTSKPALGRFLWAVTEAKSKPKSFIEELTSTDEDS
ncbi:MAG TPA: hypothetical protein DDW52_23310 [Planctomycetaceae bacterium]|nr:hypothetical protein [Planctomycetaceae bacterium]